MLVHQTFGLGHALVRPASHDFARHQVADGALGELRAVPGEAGTRSRSDMTPISALLAPQTGMAPMLSE